MSGDDPNFDSYEYDSTAFCLHCQRTTPCRMSVSTYHDTKFKSETPRCSLCGNLGLIRSLYYEDPEVHKILGDIDVTKLVFVEDKYPLTVGNSSPLFEVDEL